MEQRGFSDWGGNIAAFALVIVFNVLSNALPLNGQSMPEISAKYPSLFTPAGFTFSIWGVIYLGLAAFVIFQALPAQRTHRLIASIGPLFRLNCLANASWIVVWHYDLVATSVVIMLVILGTLVMIYRKLAPAIAVASHAEHAALYLPFSLYTGWIAVATIANVSILQLALGLNNTGMSATHWALVKLAIAGAVGATMVLRFRDAPFVLVVAWAAFGISTMQAATPAVAGAATMLCLLLLLLAIIDGVSRLREQLSK